MSSDRWLRVKELFDAALGKDPEKRAAFLSEACADDPKLRQEIESLLSADVRAGSFMQSPLAPPETGSFMVGRKLAHYRMTEKIGAGGMGEVYRAHDEQLKRDVAIKVLPPSTFQDATARARLLREARAAAALNHPYICTVHEVGEAEGQAYIAMELCAGQPLSSRLLGGALGKEEVLRYGVQLAEALEHAHDRGVVHRDLKSANVLVTVDGRVKVLDFGLAKRLGEGELDEVTRTQGTLTAPGTLVGTLAYMAPEQLRGRGADARSDLWALGVMLYEMASGARPFRGQTGFELSSSILNQAPPPLPGDVPLELQAVIERCLEKEPDRRYQRGGEVRAALEAIHAGTASRFSAVGYRLSRMPGLAWAAGVVVVLVVLVGTDAGGLWSRLVGGATVREIRSLAVLPLENHSGDPGQDYFADGMTDALITDLARLGGLKRVIARGSVMRYKGTNKPLSEIASELRADALVTGAVFRSGQRVRITAQLVDPATGEQLWAEGYERDLRDVLALQSEAARAIAHRIKLKLTPEDQTRLGSARPVNPEAYEAYLKGRQHHDQRTSQGFDRALDYYHLAVEKDPNYALAHASIGKIWASRGHFGFIPPREVLPKAKPALLKALELDDTLAEARALSASINFYHEWNWAAAETDFQRAIELNPGYADVRMTHSFFLAAMRRSEEALAELERCLELDPHNPYGRHYFAWQLLRLRRYDDAIAQLRKMVPAGQEDRRILHRGLWIAFDKKRMFSEALAEAKEYFAAQGQHDVAEALARGYAEQRYPRAMRRAAEQLEARSRQTYVLPTRIAELYALAGEKDRAFEWLEKAYQERDTLMVYLNVDLPWDNLREDPQFHDLLRRMNFPQ